MDIWEMVTQLRPFLLRVYDRHPRLSPPPRRRLLRTGRPRTQHPKLACRESRLAKTGLCLKRGAVFSVVGHVKTGPLMAKTFQMFVADKSWNTIDDFPLAALSLMFAALRRHLPVATKSLALDLEALR